MNAAILSIRIVHTCEVQTTLFLAVDGGKTNMLAYLKPMGAKLRQASIHGTFVQHKLRATLFLCIG